MKDTMKFIIKSFRNICTYTFTFKLVTCGFTSNCVKEKSNIRHGHIYAI